MISFFGNLPEILKSTIQIPFRTTSSTEGSGFPRCQACNFAFSATGNSESPTRYYPPHDEVDCIYACANTPTCKRLPLFHACRGDVLMWTSTLRRMGGHCPQARACRHFAHLSMCLVSSSSAHLVTMISSSPSSATVMRRQHLTAPGVPPSSSEAVVALVVRHWALLIGATCGIHAGRQCQAVVRGAESRSCARQVSICCAGGILMWVSPGAGKWASAWVCSG